MKKELLKSIPSVDEVLRSDALKGFSTRFAKGVVSEVVRASIAKVRSDVVSGKLGKTGKTGKIGKTGEVSTQAIIETALRTLEALLSPGMVRVVNATGTVLHTNLGRSVLSDEAVRALQEAASAPVSLEYDLEGAKRGERDCHVERLIMLLTGAEAACVVNNNAAAVLIALNTLAEGKEVIISRGELIEIGGSFRLPEIIEKSGCILREVGTTNRTHPADYSEAATEDTALILKAHTSNYTVVGFTSDVPLRELVNIGESHAVPVVEDLGSGALTDLSAFGLMKEPLVSESLRAGVDVVTFSGDKLLGGPQAGLIAGKREFVERIRQNPLKRALRVDKLTLAALEATLRLYLEPEGLRERLPALRALTRDLKEVEALAKEAKVLLKERLGPHYTIELEDGLSQVGSGSLPEETIQTMLVTITHLTKKPEEIFRTFLESTPPIIGRVGNDRFILDPRTIVRADDICPDV